MKKSFLFVIMFGLVRVGILAQSASEMADQIGMPGFWKMISMHGESNGEHFVHDLDGSSFYYLKGDGSALYSTNANKIAKAHWTLKGKTFHLWGNDTVNDPDGIDYVFKLVMVTPEKLVLKMGDGEEYVFTEFRKSNSTLTPVGSSTKKGKIQSKRNKTQNRKKR